jgi:hypothetical protein
MTVLRLGTLPPPSTMRGAQCPAFTRASQNVAMVAMFLDIVLTPSANEVDKVYHQLKDILGITTARQVENSL